MEWSVTSTTSFDGDHTRSNSRASTLTREMTFMASGELDDLCREEFSKCDGDGDGFITQEELQGQCGDDPELAGMLMKAMDSDNDGLISFEEFRSSMLKVKSQLESGPASQSTPDTATSSPGEKKNHGVSKFLLGESIFESEPSTNECEEEWFKAMERIDPAGLVSSNTELKAVWVELMMRDPALLERFESFLTEVINTLEQNQENCLQVEQHIRKVVSDHSREVIEMDGVLEDRLREISYLQKVQSQEQQRRLSNQYQGLIHDKDEAIKKLAETEEELRRQLDDQSHSEQELRREKEMLQTLNQYLKEQLKDSHRKLTVSQGLIQRLSTVANDTSSTSDGSVLLDEEPLSLPEGSLTFGGLPLSPTSPCYSLPRPQQSLLTEPNPLPLDEEVRQALLSEEEILSPVTPIPQDGGILPILHAPHPLSDSAEDQTEYSQPHETLSFHSPSKQHPPRLTHLQETPGDYSSPQQRVPEHSQSCQTLPSHSPPLQSQFKHYQLQADSLPRYANKWDHHRDSKRLIRETFDHTSTQEQFPNVPAGLGLSYQQQHSQPVLTNGTAKRLSSGSCDESSDSWTALHERSTSLEGECEDYVIVQNSFTQQEVEAPAKQSDQPVTVMAGKCSDQPGAVVASKHSDQSEAVKAAGDGQEKTSANDNAALDESPISSLASSLTTTSSSPVPAYSHLVPPTNHVKSSQPSWAARPTISVNMGTPSVSLSNFITHRADLPHPQSITPNRIFKVMFLGDSGVGKTSLIARLTRGVFTANSRSTIGLDYSVAIVQVGEERVAFQLWDTAGQERFQATTAVYLRRADAFVIVYDVTSKNSFKNVKSWLTMAKAVLRNDLPVVMIMGNKSDCHLDRVVSHEEGQKMALELSTLFSETSALSGDNVLHSQATLGSLLLEKQNNEIEKIRSSMLQLDTINSRKCRC